MSLYKGEVVVDDSNWQQFAGDGEKVVVDGQIFYTSRMQAPSGSSDEGFSTTFENAGFVKIPRSEWSARIKEQAERKRRVSDFCDFRPYNQARTLYCWNNGPTQSVTAQRRVQGLPLKIISPASVGGPVTGYVNRGGWEGDAYEYLAKHGGATVEHWPANAIDRRYADDPGVVADRPRYKVVEWVKCGSDFDKYATMCLETHAGAFAYNWMRHVMMMCDLVEIEPGSFGLRVRNSHGEEGAANEKGFRGFRVYREGKGTPDSGYMIRQVTASV